MIDMTKAYVDMMTGYQFPNPMGSVPLEPVHRDHVPIVKRDDPEDSFTVPFAIGLAVAM